MKPEQTMDKLTLTKHQHLIAERSWYIANRLNRVLEMLRGVHPKEAKGEAHQADENLAQLQDVTSKGLSMAELHLAELEHLVGVNETDYQTSSEEREETRQRLTKANR